LREREEAAMHASPRHPGEYSMPVSQAASQAVGTHTPSPTFLIIERVKPSGLRRQGASGPWQGRSILSSRSRSPESPLQFTVADTCPLDQQPHGVAYSFGSPSRFTTLVQRSSAAPSAASVAMSPRAMGVSGVPSPPRPTIPQLGVGGMDEKQAVDSANTRANVREILDANRHCIPSPPLVHLHLPIPLSFPHGRHAANPCWTDMQVSPRQEFAPTYSATPKTT
jgi:hypothetical protein